MSEKHYCGSCFWDNYHVPKDPNFKRVLLCTECTYKYGCCANCNIKYELKKEKEKVEKQEEALKRKKLLVDILKSMNNLTVDQIVEEIYKRADISIYNKDCLSVDDMKTG